MYPDPKRVRTPRVTVRFDQYEHGLVQALADFRGEQVSTMIRELMLSEVGRLLGDAMPQANAGGGNGAGVRAA